MRISLRSALPIVAVALTASLIPRMLLTQSQPQGYTSVYSASQAYSGAPWMNVKALYVRAEAGRLYYYLEYYGAIPDSRDLSRTVYIYMDTDRLASTGKASGGRGWDRYLYFYHYGDNSSYYIRLYQWNSTSGWWNSMPRDLAGMTLKPNLNYMEVWVEQEAIGYTSQGILLYTESYSYVLSLPESQFRYVLGSSSLRIGVDGDPGDWGATSPSASHPARSTEPAELEVAAFYVANDEENLYFRVDLRGTPSKTIEAAALYRYLYVYVDADDNSATGHQYSKGAEYYVYGSFQSSPAQSSYASCYKYAGTGTDWNYLYLSDGKSAFNRVLEFSVPLGPMRLSEGQAIGLHLGETSWYLYDMVPRPTNYLAFPAAAPSAGFSVIALFGSEVVFLGIVAAVMLIEAVLIFIIARRGRREIPPPPP